MAEDDPKQARLLRLYGEDEGHAVVVVGDGRCALDEVRREPPDLLVLDLMLPRVNGLEVCRTLRTTLPTLPIVMLTARSTEEDVLRGLDLGADDYVVKPFSPRQLMARIRSLLRRAAASAARHPEDDELRGPGALVLHPGRHEVRYGSHAVDCTPSEFTLLELMAGRPGQAFTRDQLGDHLNGTGRVVSRRAVDMHVMNLRRKLSAPVAHPVEIVTVYGIGYKLVVST